MRFLDSRLGERFSIERELETGGMSTVFLATDRKHGRRVAIKVLREDLAGRRGARRFLREVAIAARLTHPNILPLHDSGVVGPFIYYVMPYVEGESLGRRLAREGTLPVEEAVAIAIDCAEGLDHAHGHGVVHRDVKPGNVLLTGGRAVVADFGVARAVDAAAEDRTTGGVAVGTPPYMSPEQASGDERVDARADVYALGCVLFEMLVGEPPFGGPTAQVVIARHIAGAVPSIRVARSGVPEALEAVVGKALEKSPSDRFQSAREMADALRAMSAPPRSRRTSLALAIGFFLLALIGWAMLRFGEGAGGSSFGGAGSVRGSHLDPSHLAILPFTVTGGGEEVAAFAESLYSRLIEGLGAIEALRVISEIGIRPWAAAAVPADSVARALQVGTLVGGRVEGEGDSVRVRLQIVDGVSGEQLATALAAAALPERLSLMDAVADSVVRVLRQRLGPTVQTRRRLLETTSLEAFRQFELGRSMHGEFDQALARGDLDYAEVVLNVADSLFAEAERLDMAWVEPTIYRGRLTEHRVMLAERRPGSDLASIYRHGLTMAERGLEKSPGAPSALQLRGRLRFLLGALTRDPPLLEAAERDLRSALSANPERARVQRTLTELLIETGRYEEALAEGERGHGLDPFFRETNHFYIRLFEAAFALGRDESARDWCGRGEREYPGQPMFRHCRLRLLAWSREEEPSPDSAWTLVELILAGYPAHLRPLIEADLLSDAAAVLVRAGEADSARAVLGLALEAGIRDEFDAATRAGVLLLLGEEGRAVDLVRAYLSDNPAYRADLARRRELRDLALPAELRMLLGPP